MFGESFQWIVSFALEIYSGVRTGVYSEYCLLFHQHVRSSMPLSVIVQTVVYNSHLDSPYSQRRERAAPFRGGSSRRAV